MFDFILLLTSFFLRKISRRVKSTAFSFVHFERRKHNAYKFHSIFRKKDGGFWRKEYYIAFNGCYRYPENVTLEQTTIVQIKGLSLTIYGIPVLPEKC